MLHKSVMGWILNLLAPRCAFCNTRLENTHKICAQCIEEVLKLEIQPAHHLEISQLKILSLGFYTNWFQRIILLQKLNRTIPSQEVCKILANLLFQKILSQWRKIPILYVPGKRTSTIHLVELLTLELKKLGQPIVSKPFLFRRIQPIRPQKQLSKKQRHTRNISQVFWLKQPPQNPVLLLDDIVTTASTLLGLKKLIEPTSPVVGAITLAYTPRNDHIVENINVQTKLSSKAKTQK